ncbi:MAG: hypothetical protein ABFD69_10280 [Candidatus Sumerlaeia bacterium]
MEYKVRKNRLIYKNGIYINFKYAIEKPVEIDDILVFVLRVPTNIIFPNNAFAVKEGKLLWQIESDPRIPPSALNVYVGVVAENGKLFLQNYMGFIDVVDINTGKIIRSYESK